MANSASASIELSSIEERARPVRRAGLRILAALLLSLAALVAGTAAYLAWPVASDLYAARDLLDSNAFEVEASEVAEARQHLERARSRLESLPARILGRVPVLGSQVGVVRSIVDATIPVIDSQMTLTEALDDAKDNGILADGTIDFSITQKLESSLRSTVLALRHLESEIDHAEQGFLMPPVAAGLDDTAEPIRSLRAAAENGLEVLGIVPPALGSNGSRTYLVLLMNNAELRGAGGILAAAGSLRVSDGQLELGRFYNIDDLMTEPYVTVPAPREFVRRFGRYKADSTLWANTTFSPDFPDVALVASRLYERVTGVKTDGVIGVDPRGMARLMPTSASVKVPNRPEPLTSDTFARFVYSESYKLYRDQDYRKEVVIAAGEEVFQSTLDKNWDEYVELEEIGDAIAGGHLRIVLFREEENSVLAERGATGELAPLEGDGLFVVSQNFGGGDGRGNKMDYWAERRITHRCDIEADGSAACVSELNVRNIAPEGLIRYVAGRPYGLLRNFVEFFVPGTAKISAVRADGDQAPFWKDEQAGRTVIGTYVKAEPGQQMTVSVEYELERASDYRLLAVPQPLARDAFLSIELRVPRGWNIQGPGSTTSGLYTFEGPFRTPIRIRAFEDSAKSQL
ncbi:MAG: DUF4012 domain-containing protein [Actinobacteria bacterium]|nr:DUF4012 domain-containing protein [Actinomycetota bacterium]